MLIERIDVTVESNIHIEIVFKSPKLYFFLLIPLYAYVMSS